MDKKIRYNSGKIKIVIVCLIVIILATILIVFNNKKSNVNVMGGILQEGIIPGYSEEEIKEILQRRADESSFLLR